MNLSKFTANMDVVEETLNAIKGNKKTFEKDERQFKPNLKNEKKEYRATIRFLPQGIEGIKGGANKPYYVERWDHAFQENGQWYIERCANVLNKKKSTEPEDLCPVCRQNRRDYNSKQEVLIARAKSRRLKKTYPTNILVIEDPQCPENNGKVMYWNIPAEILKEINAKWNPESKKKAPSNPYCPVKGYALDLILKMNPATGYPTYSGSEWLDAELLAQTEQEIVEILSKTYDLSEFETNFKSFEELNKRFQKVTSGGIIDDSQTMPTIFAEEKSPVEKIQSSITLSAPEAPAGTPVVTDEGEDDESWLD